SNYRPAAYGLRLDATELAELLTGAFNRIGDFLGDFFCAGARIRRHDQRFFDRELRILQASRVQIRHNPAKNDKKNGREHNLIVSKGDSADVHRWDPQGASPRSWPFIPRRRKSTPATTTRWPGCKPSTISIKPPVAAPILTGRGLTI